MNETTDKVFENIVLSVSRTHSFALNNGVVLGRIRLNYVVDFLPTPSVPNDAEGINRCLDSCTATL